MKSERGAFVRGFDSPSGYSVHKMAGDTWRAPARCPIQRHLFGRCCMENRRQKKLDPSSMAKNILFFSGFGEERRTPRATSRPLDHGSTWYLRGRHLHTFTGLARHEAGWPWVDSMLRSKAYRRVSCFWSACWQFSTSKHKFRRMQPREQVILKSKHSGSRRVSSTDLFFE